jgi:hypothetical protein
VGVKQSIRAVLLALLLASASVAQSPDTWRIAKADRTQFPQKEWGFYYYICADFLPPEQQVTLGKVTAFTISSHSQAVVLENHLPVEVRPGLWRIDLRSLGWRWQDWLVVLKNYPYSPVRNPSLIVRADWLTVTLGDHFESDAGYLLLYKGSPPKSLKDFQKFWGVGSGDPNLALFHIEQESGVSLLGIRLLGFEDAADRISYWQTQDNKKENFSVKTDPLETLLDRNRPHDASEHIVTFPKTSSTQGAGGKAQQYLLANGQGVRQDRAPVDIVEDHRRVRGLAEIRNFSSCVVCHEEGIKNPTKNNLRETIKAGVELYADKDSQQLAEQQFLADVQFKVDVTRGQDDYQTFVALCTGWSAKELSQEFKQAFEDYDAPVTLEIAARELYVTPQELTFALGYASSAQVKLGARLASLPHGGQIERKYWESQYEIAYGAVALWKARVK